MTGPRLPGRVDVDDDDVQFDDYGTMLLYRDLPFTGEVVETSGDNIIELRTYRNGRAHGIQRTFHSDGRVRTEYTAVDGRAVGAYTRWYESGQVAERKEYDEFGVPGKIQEWDEQGRLTSGEPTEPVDLDDADVWFDESENLCHRGVPFTGEAVELIEGIVIERGFYLDGRQEGPQRAFYTDGTLRGEYWARNGNAVGVSRRWHPNGQLAERQEFDEFGRPRKVEEWDEDGRLRPGSLDSW